MSLGAILVDSIDYFRWLYSEVVVSIYNFIVSLRMIIFRLMHGLTVSEIKNKYFVLTMPLKNQPRLRRS